MKTTRGNHRVLSDSQVERILAWHTRLKTWQKQREQVLTLRAFARVYRMDPRTVAHLLPNVDEKIELLMRIRDWIGAHRELMATRAQIQTLRGLARELGVSDTTIVWVVRHKGQYKQASPELLAEMRLKRRTHLDRLRRAHLY